MVVSYEPKLFMHPFDEHENIQNHPCRKFDKGSAVQGNNRALKNIRHKHQSNKTKIFSNNSTKYGSMLKSFKQNRQRNDMLETDRSEYSVKIILSCQNK